MSETTASNRVVGPSTDPKVSSGNAPVSTAAGDVKEVKRPQKRPRKRHPRKATCDACPPASAALFAQSQQAGNHSQLPVINTATPEQATLPWSKSSNSEERSQGGASAAKEKSTPASCPEPQSALEKLQLVSQADEVPRDKGEGAQVALDCDPWHIQAARRRSQTSNIVSSPSVTCFIGGVAEGTSEQSLVAAVSKKAIRIHKCHTLPKADGFSGSVAFKAFVASEDINHAFSSGFWPRGIWCLPWWPKASGQSH